jgi:imidazolonepropionase-like amidohydrolase
MAGRLADLVLLSANPLLDIANTQKITGVLADGQYLSQPDLAKLRSQLREVAASK